MTVEPQRIHHVTLRVSDLKASRAFYEGVLGLEVDQWWEGKCRLRLGPAATSTRLVLVPRSVSTPDRFDEQRIGLDHLSLAVEGIDDLHRLVEVLRGAGVATRGVQQVPGGGHLVVCRDPDDVQLEFFADEA